MPGLRRALEGAADRRGAARAVRPAARRPGLHARPRGRSGVRPHRGRRDREAPRPPSLRRRAARAGARRRRTRTSKIPLAAATGATVWVEKQGVQRVPMTVEDLWHEVRDARPRRLRPLGAVRDLHQVPRHHGQHRALAGAARRAGAALRLRLADRQLLRRPLLRHRHAVDARPRRLAPLRHDSHLAEAGRVHDRARGRAGHRPGRPARDHPALHAVRRPARTRHRRRAAGDGGAARRGACCSA